MNQEPIENEDYDDEAVSCEGDHEIRMRKMLHATSKPLSECVEAEARLFVYMTRLDYRSMVAAEARDDAPDGGEAACVAEQRAEQLEEIVHAVEDATANLRRHAIEFSDAVDALVQWAADEIAEGQEDARLTREISYKYYPPDE